MSESYTTLVEQPYLCCHDLVEVDLIDNSLVTRYP
jgi:hypothetical protein